MLLRTLRGERCLRCHHQLTLVECFEARELACINCQMQRYGKQLSANVWVLSKHSVRTHLAGELPEGEVI